MSSVSYIVLYVRTNTTINDNIIQENSNDQIDIEKLQIPKGEDTWNAGVEHRPWNLLFIIANS